MKRVLYAALLATAIVAAAQAPAAAPARVEDDTQKVVFFGDGAPVLVELHLRLDGRSFRAAWRDFMDHLFDYLDVNRDGVLSKKEMDAAPPPAALGARVNYVGDRLFTVVRRQVRVMAAPPVDANRDKRMTRADLAEHYRRSGLAPFQITMQGSNNSQVRLFNAATGRLLNGRPSSTALNAKLFKLLDKDGDGKLSRQELAAAPAVLGKLDRDEDEMITADELLNQDELGGGGPTFFAVADLDGSMSMRQQPFHVVADGKSDRALAKRLLAQYAKKGTRKIDARAMGLSKEALDRLDRDGDGFLDEEELAHFARGPADLVLTVRLGKRGAGEPAFEVHKKGRRGMKAEATAAGVTVTVGSVRLELRAPQAKNNQGTHATRQQYLAQFKAADTDKNGYLDKAEAQRSPFFRSLFTVMDRDGDGKLFEEEVLAYVDQMAKLRARASASCLSLVIADQAKGLFELADTDGDGRLSVRELRNMVKLLDQLDQDGDGLLAPSEVPRHYRGTFEQGAVGSQRSDLRQFVTFSISGRRSTPPPQVRTRGPLWFRKMDLNQDGDVSRKEWLGTDEEFRKIDTDGDGLISVEEAEAYDRMKRAKKEK
jgi:Ca2+-binding EF-hand superfamily protein